jgi:hypothetical protein
MVSAERGDPPWSVGFVILGPVTRQNIMEERVVEQSCSPQMRPQDERERGRGQGPEYPFPGHALEDIASFQAPPPKGCTSSQLQHRLETELSIRGHPVPERGTFKI